MLELDPRIIDELRILPPVRAVARQRLRDAITREQLQRGRRFEDRPEWTLMLSPLRAALAAVLLVLATSAGWFVALEVTQTPVGRADAGAAAVQFVLIASDAQRVSLVGDFNDWDPQATPLTPGAGGLWSVVLQLARGRFSYSFLIDEREWRADPNAPYGADDFGRPTSVVYVPGPESAP